MAKQISELNWKKRLVIISFEKKEDEIYLDLFDLIDSMPMRKNEMINDKC